MRKKYDPHDDLLYLFAQLDFLYIDHIGRRVYQCRCCECIYTIQSAQVSFTAMTMPTLTWLHSSNPQPAPATDEKEYTSIPPAFYKAFEGDDWNGVLA